MQTQSSGPNEKPAPVLTPLQMAKEFFKTHQTSEDQQKRSQAIREASTLMVEEILANTKPSADQTSAIRKLRELTMILVQAISLEEVGK